MNFGSLDCTSIADSCEHVEESEVWNCNCVHIYSELLQFQKFVTLFLAYVVRDEHATIISSTPSKDCMSSRTEYDDQLEELWFKEIITVWLVLASKQRYLETHIIQTYPPS